MEKSFLGANSPTGFFSYYSDLQEDTRIQSLFIIKGGSGCGKSTFMKKLASAAEARGVQTERILCSSDPESLDGLIVPQAGMAFVDGTAPHVCEPLFCGARARYLDFSPCYHARLAEHYDTLKKIKKKNQACYPHATALLSAAVCLERELQDMAGAAAEQQAADFAERLLAEEQLAGEGTPPMRKRFLSAFTPEGVQCRYETLRAQYDRVYILHDPYALTGRILPFILERLGREAGTAFVGYSPMRPREPEQILLPERRIAIVRSAQQTPYRGEASAVLDLDACIAERLSDEERRRLAFLSCTVNALQGEAIHHLQEAKRHHDALEKICGEYVDFSAVDALTEQYCHVLTDALAERENEKEHESL